MTTEPYYQDDLVTLYHGSCLHYQLYPRWVAADVLITDPPYGTANMTGKGRGGYGRKGFHIEGDDTTLVRDQALQLWLSANVQANPPALVFGSPRMPDPPLLPIRDRLVWDKKRPGMNGGPWRYTHETIYVTDGFVRIDNAHWSIITQFPAPTNHLHSKPVALMESLIACAPPGVIADPFAGSGSTLIAARNQGRKAVGVELDEEFCKLAVQRLHAEPAQIEFEDVPW